MRRPVRALAALLLGCLLLELGMRAAGWVYLRVNQRDGLAGGQGQVLICMGDSHVFGLYEEPEDAWPAQLQGLLDAHAEDPWRVANLGFPGASSAHVAERLDSELAAYAPRAVLVTVGVNNVWAYTAADSIAELSPPWYEQLRLVKFSRILLSRGDAGVPDAPAGIQSEREITAIPVRDREGRVLVYDGSRKGRVSDEDLGAGLLRDLGRIHTQVRDAGASLVLVTYGADRADVARVNALLRAFARDQRVILADPTAAVGALAEVLGEEQVLHLDLHPRAPGYELVARAAYSALVEAELVEGAAVGQFSGPPASTRSLALVGSISGQPQALAVELSGGDPGMPFQLILFGLRDAGAAAPRPGHLAGDALLGLCMNRDDLRGTFDAEGRARVLLDVLLGHPTADLLGKVLQVGYLGHLADDPRTVVSVPASVTVTLR